MNSQKKDDIAVIKKYANRRLYNTQTSCYITQDDLFEMITRSEEFIVVDAKTGDDLTRQVLTQIIFDQESKGYNLLPIGFLKHVISLYGKNVESVLPHYLEASMAQFMQHSDEFRSMMENDWKDFNPMTMMQTMTKRNMEFFEQAMKAFTGKS